MFKCSTQMGLNTILKTERQKNKKNEEFQGFEASVGKKKSFKVRLGLD